MADKRAIPQTLRTGFAVSALALLPVFSWQALDGRSSVTVAAPAAAIAARSETIIRKSKLTWGHTKSDRLAVQQAVRQQASIRAAAEAQSDKADRETMPAVTPVALPGEFADWLVPGKSGTGAARIIDFAARKSSDNRKSCQSRHEDIVNAFSIKHARVMADQPVMFQSSICAANGEIVITCFGTSATISPRKVHPGGRCSRQG
ncbi:hypothetical protein [Anderseniella sp. Alg231-50]|uniref:hypothetical protein n=1 Tax=Anderseniella sp. Alg231-50 TaxID=1922226 RepID=UPI000D560EB2